METKATIREGHKRQGRWILVPLADLTTPKQGRICYVERWWCVTAENEALFLDNYGSPQCNKNKSIVEQIGRGFNAPATTAQYIEAAFLPHNCHDY